MTDEVHKLQVEMAELRTEIRHLSHDVKNLSSKLDNLPNNRDLAQLELRVSKVEGNLHKAAWAIISAWIAGVGVVISMFVKGN